LLFAVDTVDVPPTLVRPVQPTSETAYVPVPSGFNGGTNRSAELVALPFAVATVIGPDVAFDGTGTAMLVAVAVDGFPRIPFAATKLFTAVVEKLVPVIVTDVPTAAILAERPEIVGAGSAATVNVVEVVAVPFGVVIEIVPVVAPAGTTATTWVFDASTTVAVVPLNFTVSCAGVALNAVPSSQTLLPTGPTVGENPCVVTEPTATAVRAIDVMFPTPSYPYFATGLEDNDGSSTTFASFPAAE
jgi:hypothetical protein